VNATSTWVLLSCALTTVASHSRDTTSTIAMAQRLLARKCVKSYADLRTMPTTSGITSACSIFGVRWSA
jgi:hypothetical protein